MSDISEQIEQLKYQLKNELQIEFARNLQILEQQNRELHEELNRVRSKDSMEEGAWPEAAESRNSGNCTLPQHLEEIFNKDSLKNRKDSKHIYRVLSEYPEPKGGYLKPQAMDSYLVSEEYKTNEDKPLMECQKYLLQSIKPLLAIEFALQDETINETERLQVIKRINSDAIKLHLHFAQEVRVTRRLQAARKFNLLAKSESHETIGSSDDSLLFGPELKNTIKEELALDAARKNSSAKGNGLPRGGKDAKSKKRTIQQYYKPNSQSRPPIRPQLQQNQANNQ